MWPQHVWDELLGDVPAVSKGKALVKKVVPPSYAVEKLGWPAIVHPVKFTGTTLCLPGMKPRVYAIAAYDTIEMRYKPATGMMSCKVRSFMVGSGSPEEHQREAEQKARQMYGI